MIATGPPFAVAQGVRHSKQPTGLFRSPSANRSSPFDGLRVRTLCYCSTATEAMPAAKLVTTPTAIQ